MPIKNRFAELLPEIAAWRRDLHAHPELQFDTHRTAALVAEKLRAFGCDEVATGIGRTGVVGVIRGRSTASGRVVGLRADMDALPIEEATGLPHASRIPGVMHACGHDGHTAMLLGAAKYLAETRAFDGTVVVIFQPAEEGGGGGREMCADGMMERWNIQEVYGMHNWPGRPVGSFAIRPGAFFAATDQFVITVEGRGGHAAKPHETVDSTLVASHIVIALQSIASRNADPVGQIVVSVTSFETATKAFNVIPGRATLKGTVRTLSGAMRDLAERRLKALAEATALAFGATAEIDYMRGYPVTVNHPRETELAAEAARAVAGACDEAPLVMGGEDFAYMLEERPGAYILIGNGDTAAVHHPAYDFNDEAIPAGCSYWATLAEMRMPLAAAAAAG
jgi:hippurate hydrolase